jgi:hypothetical protein
VYTYEKVAKAIRAVLGRKCESTTVFNSNTYSPPHSGSTTIFINTGWPGQRFGVCIGRARGVILHNPVKGSTKRYPYLKHAMDALEVELVMES